MDIADQYPQEVTPQSDQYCSRPVGDEKKVKPTQKDQAPLNCPRCHSINTKFCYYNNYSLTQPRYFCKSCRRYWTAGGSLRNVPVGGGSRKNKRSNPSVSKSTGSDHDNISQFSFQNHNNFSNKAHDQNRDLNLVFPAGTQEYHSQFLQVPTKIEINKDNNIQLNLNSSYSSSCSSTSTSLSAMELLKINSTNFANSRASNTFMPAAAPTQNQNMIMYASGFHNFQEFNMSQSGFNAVDHGHGTKYEAGLIHDHGNGNNEENISGAADHQTLVFPFGALSKQISSTNGGADQNKEDGNPTLYWNGMSNTGRSW